MAFINVTGFEGDAASALPVWLRDDQGQAFEATFGRTKDDALALLKEAVKARWPDANRPDALPLLGADRLILRAPPETDAEYADRLVAAHDTWLWAGTPTAMVNLLNPYGYDAATVAVVPNHQVLLDGNLDWFSRFLMLGGRMYWSSDGIWSDPGTYDDGGTWDTDATVADLDYLRMSVRAFKSPWSFPLFFGVQLLDGTGDGFWDQLPGDVWDLVGAVWTDDVDTAIWPLGHVWGDEAWLGGQPVWDGSAGDVWERDQFVPPSMGWHLTL